MRRTLVLLFLTFNISFANAPVVWSKTGHRVIGEVAQIAVRREIAGLHRDEAAQAIGWQGVAADLAFAGRAQIKACA